MRHRIRGRNKCPRAPTGFLPGPSITSGLTGGAVWSDPNIDYTDLSPTDFATVYLDVAIEAGAEGLILEAGGSGISGMCIGIGTDGILYAKGGNGTVVSGSDVMSTSYVVPAPGRYIFEFTADTSPLNGARLYTNGNIVSTSSGYTVEASAVAGSAVGGIERIHGTARTMPAGCNNNLSGVTINRAEVWNQFIPV